MPRPQWERVRLSEVELARELIAAGSDTFGR